MRRFSLLMFIVLVLSLCIGSVNAATYVSSFMLPSPIYSDDNLELYCNATDNESDDVSYFWNLYLNDTFYRDSHLTPTEADKLNLVVGDGVFVKSVNDKLYNIKKSGLINVYNTSNFELIDNTTTPGNGLFHASIYNNETLYVTDLLAETYEYNLSDLSLTHTFTEDSTAAERENDIIYLTYISGINDNPYLKTINATTYAQINNVQISDEVLGLARGMVFDDDYVYVMYSQPLKIIYKINKTDLSHVDNITHGLSARYVTQDTNNIYVSGQNGQDAVVITKSTFTNDVNITGNISSTIISDNGYLYMGKIDDWTKTNYNLSIHNATDFSYISSFIVETEEDLISQYPYIAKDNDYLYVTESTTHAFPLENVFNTSDGFTDFLPSGTIINNVNISSNVTTRGQNWTLSCMATDGTNSSQWVNSSITISNSAPYIEQSEIQPSPAFTNDTLQGYCNASDIDEDRVFYNYSWYKNGASLSSGKVFSSIWVEENKTKTNLPGFVEQADMIYLKSTDAYNFNNTNNPTIFNGKFNGQFNAFEWYDNKWNEKPAYTSGLIDYGGHSGLEIVYNLTGNNEWSALTTVGSGSTTVYGYVWNGTDWESNNTVKSGMVSPGAEGSITVMYDVLPGEWTALINGANDNDWNGYIWNGSGWESNITIKTGLDDASEIFAGQWSYPNIEYGYNVYGKNKKVLLISVFAGYLYGYEWDGSSWQRNDTYKNGYIRIPNDEPTPAFIQKAGNYYDLVLGHDAGWVGYSHLFEESINTNIINLSSLNFVLGDNITFSCIATDIHGNTSSVWTNSSQLTIINTPPVIQNISILPSPAYTNDTLQGYCNASDINEDGIIYEWYWYLNDVQYSSGKSSINTYTGFNFSVSSQMIFPTALDTNDNKYYLIEPISDRVYEYASNGTYTGFNFSTTVQDNSPRGIFVNNSNFYVLGTTTNKVYEYASNGIYTGFNFSVAAQDTNVGGITIVNGFFYIVGTATNKVYEYASNGIYTGFNFSVGEGNGAQDIDFINNHFYITSGVNIIYEYNTSGTYTQLNYNVSEQEDNILTGVSFQNNKMYIVGTDQLKVFEYDLGHDQNIVKNLNNISNAFTEKGQNWTFSCQADDGSAQSDWFNVSLVISNSKPIIQYTTFDENISAADNLTITINATDIDEEDSGWLTVIVDWFVNAVYQVTDIITNVFSGDEVNSTLNESYYNQNDNVSWNVTVQDNESLNSTVFTDSVVITGGVPLATNFLIPPSTNFSNESDLTSVSNAVLATTYGQIGWINIINVLDTDLDNNVNIGAGFVSLNTINLDSTLDTNADVIINLSAIGTSCDSYKLYYANAYYDNRQSIIDNGVKVGSDLENGRDCTDDTTCQNVQCSNGVLTFQAQHFDGFGAANNTAPNMTESIIEPSIPYTNDTLVGYCNATDADDNNVGYSYNWYKNSQLYSEGISYIWESDSSLINGLVPTSLDSRPQLIYNFTGNGEWSSIVGRNDGNWDGYDWNGTEWIANASLVTGLPDVGSESNPGIVYNFSNNNKWTLFTGSYNKDVRAFEWNGATWAENTSLAAGVVTIGDSGSTHPTVVYDLIPGKWAMIEGNWSVTAGFKGSYIGYVWNGTSWEANTTPVNGLPTGNYFASEIIYNLNDDNKWVAVLGKPNGQIPGGYEWNGSMWIFSAELTNGLPTIADGWAYPSIVQNFSGTLEWSTIIGEWNGGDFSGFVYNRTNNAINNIVNIVNISSSEFILDDNITLSCRAFDGTNYSDWYNSSTTTIQNTPISNITLYETANDTLSNQPLFTNFTVSDPDEGIVCNLTVEGVDENSTSILSGTVGNMSHTPATDGDKYWNVSCVSTGDTIGVTSETRLFRYDTTGPAASDFGTDESAIWPNIGDNISLNWNVTDMYYIDTCRLEMNDTGSWTTKENFSILSSAEQYIQTEYEIQNYSTTANKSIGWRIWCNDSLGNSQTSAEQLFVVKDTVNPGIYLNSGATTFDEDNMSVISSASYNVSYSVSYFDHNLFQTMINVSCTKDGQIYYWEQLDWNVTGYTQIDDIDLTNITPQKCTFFAAASDDHTVNEIPKYGVNKLENGLEFITEHGAQIKILTVDKQKSNNGNAYAYGKYKVKNTKSKKNVDRYNFDFEYEDKQLTRTFKLISSEGKKLHYRPNSGYTAHFVAWDETTKTGNWVDFEELNNPEKIYSVERISDYEYDITITSVVPEDALSGERYAGKKKKKGFLGLVGEEMTTEEMMIDEFGIQLLQFSSIGGTNVINQTWEFYVGGTIDMNNFNIYNSSAFTNSTLEITNIDAYPAQNYSINITGSTYMLENVSEGNYTFFFDHSEYMNKTYVVEVSSDVRQNVTYNTSQAVVYIAGQNAVSLSFLEDLNISVINVGDATEINKTSGNVTYTPFYLNAGNYTLNISKYQFQNYNTSFNVSIDSNITIIGELSIIAHLTLIDEYTLELFNLSNPDIEKTEFFVFCDEELGTGATYVTPLISNEQDVSIPCPYKKWKFIVTYTDAIAYYRTILVDPDEAFDVEVYLIDATTTEYLYTTFGVDDLLNRYDNPQIHVHRTIGNESKFITGDYVDIEGKVGAYLVTNYEYTIEIHSDNQPVRVMGNYFADFGGDKILRLYDIDLSTETQLGYENDVVAHATFDDNLSGVPSVVVAYADYTETTGSVQINVYEGSTDGPLLASTTVTGENYFDGDVDVTGHENKTLVVSMLTTNTNGQTSFEKASTVAKNMAVRLSALADGHLNAEFLNWFFTILFGVLALAGTIQTANIASIATLGLAVLFVAFGWYGLSAPVLAVSIFISVVSMLKQGEKA